MTAQETPVLEVRAAVKRFGGVYALNEASLTLHRGEILALLGDNGAGKSTLIKSISGAYRIDGGRILVDGQPVSFKHSSDARAMGIETVYQDLALFDNLPAAANFYAGREMVAPSGVGRSWGFLRERKMFTQTTETLERLRVRIPSLTLPVGLMSGGQRQAIAVARAVAFATKVVLLDEPTAALGLRESAMVLDLVRSLPEHGVSVILISHNLEHVMDVANRAVVLRRGRIVGEEIPTPETHERLVSLIVGGADATKRNNHHAGPDTSAHVPNQAAGSRP
jgi:ABC-type sugar transport system ATPase subunit